MSKLRGIFKKADLILLAVLLAGGLCASMVIARSGRGGDQVEIKVAGELYGSYPLDEDRKIEVRSGSGVNVVTISGGSVSVTESNCANQVCVRHKAISSGGDSIICLPHKVVVSVISKKGDEGYDTIAR